MLSWKNFSSAFATFHLVLADRRATARTTTFVEPCSIQTKKRVASGFRRIYSIVGVPVCLCHTQLRQILCQEQKNKNAVPESSFSPILLDRSLLRKHLSFLCVIFTSSCLVLLLWFQHSQLGRILPEDVSVIDPQGSRRDLHILIKTITKCNFRANKAHQPTGHDHSRWVEACLLSYKSSTTQPPTDRLCM